MSNRYRFFLPSKAGRHTSASLAVTLATLVLSACVPPSPGVHEILKISDEGGYSLNGLAIPREQLRDRLAAERLHVQTLYAEIIASPQSDIADVKYAVEALKATHVRFAFIDEKVMHPGKLGAAGDSRLN